MKISILVNNIVSMERDILAEHGLSIFIEHDGKNILFDAGQSDTFLYNASVMDIDLGNTDLIAISHGHFDHSGGLINFPFEEDNTNPDIPIYIQEKAFENKYAFEEDKDEYEDAGIPWSLDDYPIIKENLHFSGEKTEISEGIYLVGGIENTTDFEELAPSLFMGNEDEKYPDPMLDEQALVIDTPEGLCIFLGCSHPGVISCLNRIKELFPGKKIYSLLAGMHLEKKDDRRLSETIKYFREYDIQKIMPMHCTGIMAITEMKKSLDDRCVILYTGDTYII